MENTSTRTPKYLAAMKWPSSWIRMRIPSTRATDQRIVKALYMRRIIPSLFCYNGTACACLSGFQLLDLFPCPLPGFGVYRQHVLNRFRRPGASCFKYAADYPGDFVKSNGSCEERGHRYLVGGIQGHGPGASSFRGLIGQGQTRKLLHVRRAEIQMT